MSFHISMRICMRICMTERVLVRLISKDGKVEVVFQGVNVTMQHIIARQELMLG